MRPPARTAISCLAPLLVTACTAYEASRERPWAEAIPWSEPACGVCAERQCRELLDGCEEKAACREPFECLATCARDDRPCRRACLRDAKAGSETQLGALLTCQTTQCTEACTRCGSLFHNHEQEACGDCIESRCCDVATACAKDEDCATLARCVAQCDGIQCRELCIDIAPEPTQELYGNARDCFLPVWGAPDDCGAECERGGDWSCVGRVKTIHSRPDEVARITYTAVFSAYGETYPLEGEIRACRQLDADCVDPAEGPVSFSADRASIELDAGFSYGYVEITGPDTVPYLSYFGYPPLTSFASPESPISWELAQQIVASFSELRGTHGALTVFVGDCQGEVAPGVDVAITDRGEAGRVVLTTGGFVVSEGTTQPGTDAQVNYWPLTPGTHEVIGTYDGREVARTTVLVRAGAQTVVFLVPTEQ